MTIWELTRILVRRWPAVLICIVVTAAAGYAAVRTPGGYYTRTELVFLAPTSRDYPNSLRTQSDDLIYTAGVVAKRVSGAGAVTKFASPDVTLVGLGVRNGWELRLPDTGGQWASNYATQTLILDIVAPTYAAVRDRQSEVIARVQVELHDLQVELNVASANQISVIAAPESTVIFAVSGNRYRALGMTILLGFGVTIAVVLVLDRRARMRSAAGATSAVDEAGAR